MKITTLLNLKFTRNTLSMTYIIRLIAYPLHHYIQLVQNIYSLMKVKLAKWFKKLLTIMTNMISLISLGSIGMRLHPPYI